MPRILIAIVALIFSPLAGAAELAAVTWPTRHAAPPPDFGAQGNAWLPAFRVALGTLPESSVTALALTQPALLGLSPGQAQTLLPLVTERYRLMAAAPAYGEARSALPYCYSAERPAQGFANLYVPEGASSSTPVILFLHGYGGSFLWYQHWLSETFPDHIILCPGYGISTGLIPPEYLSEAITAGAKHLGFSLAQPCLIGLSAGGFGACRVFVREPGKFRQLICLAAYPMDDTLRLFPPRPPGAVSRRGDRALCHLGRPVESRDGDQAKIAPNRVAHGAESRSLLPAHSSCGDTGDSPELGASGRSWAELEHFQISGRSSDSPARSFSPLL